MKKMLVVDDEASIRQLIKKYASRDNFTVVEASNGIEAIEAVLENDFEIIILDLMMPEMNGFDACKQIREETKAPIIMLTARDGEFDKYQGFELGIDDYVVKPFSPRELMYRVEAILKRTNSSIQNDSYTLDDLVVNFAGRSVRIGNERIDVSPKEYELLVYLIKNKGLALERDQIISKVWGYDFEGDDRTLDTHIKRLRRKLGDYQGHIVTLRGIGYRFDEK
ncbi:response regulator transcription factor [Erysipelothrix sp. HDW6A]|uniref:response regulator transcription factor n=1 Tax=Erysipelothrix sp. HDW6A TaxID=2714928 RepID=UPI00140A4047|nr:response regulator transcription factor [Erysipelothrix sp. HDW6A]QIK57099.1 response regulator transcription factor [Erysipelothrix sp. HDW6A]